MAGTRMIRVPMRDHREIHRSVWIDEEVAGPAVEAVLRDLQPGFGMGFALHILSNWGS